MTCNAYIVEATTEPLSAHIAMWHEKTRHFDHRLIDFVSLFKYMLHKINQLILSFDLFQFLFFSLFRQSSSFEIFSLFCQK